MKNTFTKKFVMCALSLITVLGLVTLDAIANESASTTVSGTVVDNRTNEPLIGANIIVRGTVRGVATDLDGNFTITTNQNPPIVLVISSVGYRSQEVAVTESNVSGLVIRLQEQSFFGADVVVSASRVEQSILRSPVSIEKMDAIAIRESAAPSFYDAIRNLKGVDFSTQSLTFSSVNTRGFAANGNTRFVQLIDGIDNQAPGLNFPVGNIVGISELDLESAELIPGVASALYGPNALNGILILNSKSPFEYQGLSVKVTTGVNHVDGRDYDVSPYQDYSIRYANAVNNRFAYKFNFSYLRARDFIGVDMRDQGPAVFGVVERGATTRGNNRYYNGVNKYGQPLVTIGGIADGVIAAGSRPGASPQEIGTANALRSIRSLLPDGEAGLFTPTGFEESSFVDNLTESIKFGTALHYRLGERYELLGQFNYGAGSTVYTANDRFVLDGFSIWTAKLELRNPNFFARLYTTQENSGDTYAANTVASLINRDTFIPAYFGAYVGAIQQQLVNPNYTNEMAHAAARAAANAAQPQPGSAQFQELFEKYRNLPISEGGAKFLDKSALWHGEVMYNLSEYIDPSLVEVVIGGNVRRYALRSEGTLFALQDNGDEFNIDEFGAYSQFTKGLFEDRLSLQASLRYDKNEYFAGQFSPRFSAVYTFLDTHNIRLSAQRGFRLPSTQDQFIDLDVVTRRLIGANPVLVDRYRFESNTVYLTETVEAARIALASGASAADARALLKPVEFGEFKTEKVTSFEVGYKALFGNRLFLDMYYYYSVYNDFLAEIDFTQAVPNGLTQDPGAFNPNSPEGQDAIINQTVPLQSYGFDVNADGNVKAHGFAIGADYVLGRGYTLGGNMAFNELISEKDLQRQGFSAGFNTPKWRYNIQFRNRQVTDRIGFNLTYRWQDAFVWESAIGEGVIPAFGTLDAQVSYRIPDLRTIVKFSGSNILNKRHTTSFANPSLGAIYMVSFTFDQFLN
jgi:outer membrane receptor protein involved in Fe transport